LVEGERVAVQLQRGLADTLHVDGLTNNRLESLILLNPKGSTLCSKVWEHSDPKTSLRPAHFAALVTGHYSLTPTPTPVVLVDKHSLMQQGLQHCSAPHSHFTTHNGCAAHCTHVSRLAPGGGTLCATKQQHTQLYS
jgi:hypothetical protein